MTHDFEERFPEALAALRALFGSEQITADLPRMKEIYDYTEARWREYADRVRTVRFLMIAEAPPWRSDGTPQYMLDPDSHSGPYLRALRRAFPGAMAGSSRDALRILADRGFLLLDSVPFARDYSRERHKEDYGRLVGLTVVEHLQSKATSAGLVWSPDVRIAFGVKRNANAILRATTHLSFGGHPSSLAPEMIAVSGSGYPDARALRDIYGLDGDNGS
jgi:hypothetical protein